MSITPASKCPRCGSRDFREFMREEANEYAAGSPSEDTAWYECGNDDCGAEFFSTDEGAR